MFFEANLQTARVYCPWIDYLLAGASGELKVEARRTAAGELVPEVSGIVLTEAENPAIPRLFSEDLQQRVIVFGFAFGQHLRHLVQKGFSPIVYEPSPDVLKAALTHVDLRDILPYLTIYSGQFFPDIPRVTRIVAVESYARNFPQYWEALRGKALTDFPEHSDDIVEGEYAGAYRNITCLKNPCDLAVYQMILSIVRPTLLIEIGACRGGSALLFADFMRNLGGERRIHTFDIVDTCPIEVLSNPMITFHGDGWTSFDPGIIKPDDRVLIIEDSSHTYENTLGVLHHFADYVSPNSYLIVEDGAAGLVRPSFNGGAVRAIDEFLAADDRFRIDQRWETFYGSRNSNCLRGFLHRRL